MPTRGRAALLVLTGALLVAICLVFAFVMAGWYRDVGRGLGASGESVAAAVAQTVDRNIELLDFSLKAVTEQWGASDVQALSPRLRDLVLFDQSMQAPGFGMVFVLDASGRLVADSIGTTRATMRFDDRDYFRVHLASGDLGLFVSKPIRSRINGHWSIALSRRIDGPGKTFGGVAVGTIDLSYLTRLYEGLGAGAESAVTLFRTDGTVLTRAPLEAGDIGLWSGSSDAFTRMRASRAGTFEGESPITGLPRIISYHRVGKSPLIQVVEVAGDAAYTGWWRRAAAVAGLLTLLCLGSMGLSVTLYRELGRRSAAEAELARLAGTDALTGLANRRRFEAALAARAQRAADPLALLMIDADAFKAYNDLRGHQAGDAVLQAVATALESEAGRRGGLACRYGGEEFVVLLPGCDATAALEGAEAMRAAVQALGLRHPGSAEEVVTISVGVAARGQGDAAEAGALLSAADAALYLAKAAGRNRCRALPDAGLPIAC